MNDMETKNGLNYKLESLDGLRLTIYEQPNSKLIYIPLVIGVVILMIPIIIFPFIVAEDRGVPLGFVITCVIALLTGGYLLRMYLWNAYGSEVFIIKQNTFSTYYDYKFFKDNVRTFRFQSVAVHGIEDEKNTSGSEMIAFCIDEQTFSSREAIPIDIITQIAKILKQSSCH